MFHNGVLQSHMATLCRTARSTDLLYSAEVKRLQKYHFFSGSCLLVGRLGDLFGAERQHSRGAMGIKLNTPGLLVPLSKIYLSLEDWHRGKAISLERGTSHGMRP